jgi:glycosyltransferase involved in cell wall biosynthesis
MTKLLTICIPTYKRPITLRRCIISVVEQIQRYGLEEQVQIYVTNDASPDNTVQVLEEFKLLNFYKHVTREKNLGMSANIKCMLEEALLESTFQLIITDDDYMQPDTLDSIAQYLADQLIANPDVPLIWTPRYSYTEDGKLHCVVCKPFKEDTLIPPSIRNAGRYMFNGFVLSGLIVKANDIDFSLWNEHLENAYFPVIFSGDLISRKPSLFWDMNIVYHSVFNECHWERWGQSEAEITLRLFIDFVNAYAVIGRKIKPVYQSLVYYASALSSILKFTNGLVISTGGFFRLSDSESDALMSIKRVSFSKVEMPVRIIFFIVSFRILFDCMFKTAILKLLSFITPGRSKREKRKESFERHRRMLANAAFMMRWSH